jgi:hypothetical protein|tara:strand:- start:159 stop:365 length:207 start_codon:yes stop_codon:yes gene_type:complete
MGADKLAEIKTAATTLAVAAVTFPQKPGEHVNESGCKREMCCRNKMIDLFTNGEQEIRASPLPSPYSG